MHVSANRLCRTTISSFQQTTKSSIWQSQDALFGEVYGGGRAPVSPVAFLRTWWHAAGGHLEGYQQQDAHEFYLNALSGLVRRNSTYGQTSGDKQWLSYSILKL